MYEIWIHKFIWLLNVGMKLANFRVINGIISRYHVCYSYECACICRQRTRRRAREARYSEPAHAGSQDLVEPGLGYLQRDPYKMGQYTDIWRCQPGQGAPGSAQQLHDTKVVAPPSSGYQTMSMDSTTMVSGSGIPCSPGSPGRTSHLYESPKFKRREYYSQNSMT